MSLVAALNNSEKSDFVSWDDEIPNCFWNVIKFHGLKPPTSHMSPLSPSRSVISAPPQNIAPWPVTTMAFTFATRARRMGKMWGSSKTKEGFSWVHQPKCGHLADLGSKMRMFIGFSRIETKMSFLPSRKYGDFASDGDWNIKNNGVYGWINKENSWIQLAQTSAKIWRLDLAKTGIHIKQPYPMIRRVTPFNPWCFLHVKIVRKKFGHPLSSMRTGWWLGTPMDWSFSMSWAFGSCTSLGNSWREQFARWFHDQKPFAQKWGVHRFVYGKFMGFLKQPITLW